MVLQHHAGLAAPLLVTEREERSIRPQEATFREIVKREAVAPRLGFYAEWYLGGFER